MAQIRSKPFGVTKEGANVTEYILSNPGGMSVSVLDYGCVIKNIIVPAKNGPVDVVLGHDTMADYENDFTSSGSVMSAQSSQMSYSSVKSPGCPIQAFASASVLQAGSRSSA